MILFYSLIIFQNNTFCCVHLWKTQQQKFKISPILSKSSGSNLSIYYGSKLNKISSRNDQFFNFSGPNVWNTLPNSEILFAANYYKLSWKHCFSVKTKLPFSLTIFLKYSFPYPIKNVWTFCVLLSIKILCLEYFKKLLKQGLNLKINV